MAKILHIEDNTDYRNTIKQALEEAAGHQVISVESIPAAREMLAHSSFDVIVSDNHIGAEFGTAFAVELHDKGSRTPFILLTSRSLEEACKLGGLEQTTPALGMPISAYVDKVESRALKKLAELVVRFTEPAAQPTVKVL